MIHIVKNDLAIVHHLVGGFKHVIMSWSQLTNIFFHFIYGMSSFPLTYNTHIFQDADCTTNQIMSTPAFRGSMAPCLIHLNPRPLESLTFGWTFTMKTYEIIWKHMKSYEIIWTNEFSTLLGNLRHSKTSLQSMDEWSLNSANPPTRGSPGRQTHQIWEESKKGPRCKNNARNESCSIMFTCLHYMTILREVPNRQVRLTQVTATRADTNSGSSVSPALLQLRLPLF